MMATIVAMSIAMVIATFSSQSTTLLIALIMDELPRLLSLSGSHGTLEDFRGHKLFELSINRLRLFDELLAPFVGELDNLDLIADLGQDLLFVLDGKLARIITGHLKGVADNLL